MEVHKHESLASNSVCIWECVGGNVGCSSLKYILCLHISVYVCAWVVCVGLSVKGNGIDSI